MCKISEPLPRRKQRRLSRDFTTPEYKKLDQIPTKEVGSVSCHRRFVRSSPGGGAAADHDGRGGHSLAGGYRWQEGNLLLDVGPEAAGTIPGKAEDGTDVWFTEKDGSLYILLMQRPRERTISMPHMPANGWQDAPLLGSQEALTGNQQLDFVRITLPKDMEPQAAYAIRRKAAKEIK